MRRSLAGYVGAVSALSLLACAMLPAEAAPSIQRRRLSGASGISLPSASGIGSFTPAAADPRRSATAGLAGAAGGGSGFRFTPSATPGGRRAVTVAVRARSTLARADAQRAIVTNLALAPSAYNLGASIGWKKFALSGDFEHFDGGLLPTGREAVDVGVSYTNRRWSTRIQFGADRSLGQRPAMIGVDQSYSVDLGGSYALSRNLDLAGGVRYRTQRDRLEAFSDQRRDSQSVYVGTAFRF